MKTFLIITGIVIVLGILGFFVPPPDGIFRGDKMAPDLLVGDKVRYIGDLQTAYNKIGWVVSIDNKFHDRITDNPTPYMVAFTEKIDHMEEVAKWRKHWEENKGDYSSYGASHPFPFSLPDELRWVFNNRVWASDDQLELITTSFKKDIKEGEKILMPINLETLNLNELNKAKKALVSPNSLNIEIKL